MIDIMTPEGVSVDVKDAIGDVVCPELIGRLVQVMADKGILSADDLNRILPPGYFSHDYP